MAKNVYTFYKANCFPYDYYFLLTILPATHERHAAQ